MAGFNNPFVPEYAHKDTPAIRPREIHTSQEVLRSKANRMKAYSYVKKFIDDNWKPGSRFYFTTAKRKVYSWELEREYEVGSDHAGKTGVFIGRVLLGNTWYINIQWDDPNYSPRGLGKHRVGMFEFFHYAFFHETAERPAGPDAAPPGTDH